MGYFSRKGVSTAEGVLDLYTTTLYSRAVANGIYRAIAVRVIVHSKEARARIHTAPNTYYNKIKCV